MPHLTTADLFFFFQLPNVRMIDYIFFSPPLPHPLYPSPVEITRNVPRYVSGDAEKLLFNWWHHIHKVSTSKGRIWFPESPLIIFLTLCLLSLFCLVVGFFSNNHITKSE